MLCPICHRSVTVPVAEDGPSAGEIGPPPISESGSACGDQPPKAAALDSAATVSVPPPLPSPRPAGSAGGTPTIELRCEPATVWGSTPGARPSVRIQSGSGPPWGLTAGLLAVLAFSMLPALRHLREVPMPWWARGVIGVAMLQAVFVLWMLIVRHWAAMVVVMLSFAMASTTYAIFAWAAFALSSDRVGPPGQASRVGVWCFTVAVVYLVTTYFCGAAALSWRRRSDKTPENVDARRPAGPPGLPAAAWKPHRETASRSEQE